MDLYCSNCGEPWDVSCIVEVKHGLDDDPAWKLDSSGVPRRCPCCPKGEDGQPARQTERSTRANAAGIISELLGDDLDGAAALLEDAQYLGLLDE